MEWKEIEFVIVIDSEGNFKRFESKRIDKKKCESFLVAATVQRPSNKYTPNILWDNKKYVLGENGLNEPCNSLFVSMVRKIAERHKEDASINALSAFYNIPYQDRVEKLASDPYYEDVMKATSNLSFRYEPDDELIAEKKYLYDFILNETENDKLGRCLITGTYGPIIRISTPTPIPNSSPSASLVTFQTKSGYDSYGKSQAYNSPISTEVEEAYSRVLKFFLRKDSQYKILIGDRTFLFWGTGNNVINREIENNLICLFNDHDQTDTEPYEKIDKVSKIFKSIYSGKIKTTLDDRFHILGLAPNMGRIAVVMWMDTQLQDFAQKIIDHFDSMELVDIRKPKERCPYVGVYSMVSAVTRGGKISDALSNLIESTMKAVLYGTPYPYPLFTGAIQRIRAELSDIGPNIQRVAILKAYLNRQNKNLYNNKQLDIMLDKNNTNPGYLCGRLTAVLEKIQSDVNTGDSIRTRYMGAASATPATVIPAMLNLSLHHSEKLPDDSRRFSRRFYEELKQEIIDKISEKGFPSHLDLNDQGRFFVGYYHQRADLYS